MTDEGRRMRYVGGEVRYEVGGLMEVRFEIRDGG